MAKNLQVAKPQAPAVLEISEAELALASYLEVDLAAAVELQMQRVKDDVRTGIEASLRIGLRLIAMRAKCQHGEFERLVFEAGIGERDSQSCMQLASAYAAEGDARRREALLGMGKTKAVALLGANPKVREQIMESPELLKEMLEGSTRAAEAQIKELKKTINTLEAKEEIKASRKANEAESHFVTPDIPYLVTDIRREAAALYQQAKLAIASLHDLAPQLDALQDVKGCAAWASPSKLQAFTALRSLHASLGIYMAAWVDEHGMTSEDLPTPEHKSFYRPEEAALVQRHFEALTTAHQDGQTKRANKAANDAPGARGAKRKNV